MIDPMERWREYGEKPDFAGLLTWGGVPTTQDPDELHDVDVAIIGAPMDDLVSDRPGTRFAPRAIRAASCPPGPHLAVGVDAFEVLRIVDFGDAAVVPARPEQSHAAIRDLVGTVAAAATTPMMLGGDHSVTGPALEALARVHGPLGLVHFDTHTDTGEHVFGATQSHGTMMRRAVEAEHVDPSRYVQVGLRGYWPGAAEFAWQREQGIRWHTADDIHGRGIDSVIADVVAAIGSGPVYVSVDVDVLDPAFAPGTGTPEPGGLTSGQLLRACRTVASELSLVGADVVEVLPTQIGSADITALAADRVVRELLTGIAMRR